MLIRGTYYDTTAPYFMSCVTSTSSSESEPSQLLPELASTSTALMSILDIGVDRVPHGSGSVARRLVERSCSVDVCCVFVFSHFEKSRVSVLRVSF